MRTMWRATVNLIAVTITAAAILVGTQATPVFAVLTGHEPFVDNAEVCYVCHRAHTATAENLLYNTSGMCLTCHSAGAGADTDVTSGIYVRPYPTRHGIPWGEVGAPLLGGGFTNVDTDGDGTSEPTAYGTDPVNPGTSQHDVGLTQTPFGSASGASIKLDCASCHTLHARSKAPNQYRYLRLAVGDNSGPLDVSWNGPWEGSAQQIPKAPGGEYMAYTETDFGGGLTYDPLGDVLVGSPIEYTRNYRAGMSAWCSGCHTVYINPEGPYNIGDGKGAVTRHKHIVDVTLTNTGRISETPNTNLPLGDPEGTVRNGNETINCLTCHRAHGTTARMNDMAIAAPVASRGVLPGMTTSMLLRRDNRGVCIDCHWYLKGTGL